MISVSITPSGDVAYVCSICDRTDIVPKEGVKSAFWDTYNGRTILMMLGHYGDAHAPDLLERINK